MSDSVGFFFVLTNFILSSPSLAQSFIQICPNGVQEVGGIDVVLVKLDAEGGDEKSGSGFCIYRNEASIRKVDNKHYRCHNRRVCVLTD